MRYRLRTTLIVVTFGLVGLWLCSPHLSASTLICAAMLLLLAGALAGLPMPLIDPVDLDP
jgi:hypothetical protein